MLGIIILAVLFGALLNGDGSPTATAVSQNDETPTNAVVEGTASVTALDASSAQASDTPEMTEEPATDTPEPTTEVAATDTEEPATDTPEPTTEVVATDTEEPATDTPEPTTEVAATDTEEPATDTPEPTENPSQAILNTLNDFELSGAEPVQSETNLGNTLLVEVCLDSNMSRAELLDGTLQALSAASDSIDASVDAMGITLFDCESETAFRAIAVPVDTLQDFNNGTITLEDFQRSWEAVD